MNTPNEKIKLPSNRKFVFFFFFVFLAISIWPLYYGEDLRVWSLIISLVLLSLSLLNSKVLSPFNKLWMNLGLILGNFISPIIMGIIYFGLITPTGILLKLIKKDILNLNKTHYVSYWVEKEKKYKSDFRIQY